MIARSFLFRPLISVTLALVLGLAPLSAPRHAFAADTKTLEISTDHGTPLTFSAPATSVFIANPDIADVQVMSPTSVMVYGKRTGETTFMATDSGGNTLVNRTVLVTQNLDRLRDDLDNILPDSHIEVEALPNGIVLTGEAKDTSVVADATRLAQRYLSAGGDIINRIRINASNQIHIRVRFAEVSRNIDRSLGISWQNVASYGGTTIGLITGVSQAIRPNNTALSLPNDTIGFSSPGQRMNINAMIDALEQEGLITILAEPNLTALSGETATFLAGGEFPIPIPQVNNAITIEFKPYGVSLSFTPTLVGEDRINLHVKPEVSELTTTGSIILQNIAVPALTTRKAETTIEVASGQSFVIAGLLDNNQTQLVNKYPLLGDLPILGPLFRSDRYQSGQTELVILITPYIVKPTGQQMALPVDGFSPPSEKERMLQLHHSNQDPTARPMSGPPVGMLPLPPKPSELPVPLAKAPQELIIPPVPKEIPTPLPTSVEKTMPEIPPQESAPAAAPSSTNGFILE